MYGSSRMVVQIHQHLIMMKMLIQMTDLVFHSYLVVWIEACNYDSTANTPDGSMYLCSSVL